MEIEPDIDVFVGNSVDVDFGIFQLWLQQVEAQEAVSQFTRQTDLEQEVLQKNQPLYYLLDQYRMFGMLEQMLRFPLILGNQLTYQVSPEVQKKLVAMYFNFDEVVIRELLGKKLSKSTRRDLDEISAKCQIQLKSCQRQFDNCRRIFKAMEDATGSMVENIKLQFLLSPELAWCYSAIVFLSSHRFECSKRKLTAMTFNDFIGCAKCLIKTWTSSSPVSDTDPDRNCHLENAAILKSSHGDINTDVCVERTTNKNRSISIEQIVNNCLSKGILFTARNQTLRSFRVYISPISAASSDVDLDQDFLHELRGTKILIADQRVFDLHKTVTSQAVANCQGDGVSCQWCDSLFRQLSRGLVSIATNLYKTKDTRDYFVDLVERVVEPCKAFGLEKDKLKLFLSCYASTSEQFSHLQQYKTAWNRYLAATSTCLLEIYRP